jgi:hypothetical protein
LNVKDLYKERLKQEYKIEREFGEAKQGTEFAVVGILR